MTIAKRLAFFGKARSSAISFCRHGRLLGSSFSMSVSIDKCPAAYQPATSVRASAARALMAAWRRLKSTRRAIIAAITRRLDDGGICGSIWPLLLIGSSVGAEPAAGGVRRNIQSGEIAAPG